MRACILFFLSPQSNRAFCQVQYIRYTDAASSHPCNPVRDGGAQPIQIRRGSLAKCGFHTSRAIEDRTLWQEQNEIPASRGRMVK